MEQALALVAQALASPVPRDRWRVRGPVLLPVAGVLATPLAGALAANLAIDGVSNQFLLAAIGAPALLAGGLGAYRLLGMASGGLELLVAITAAPLNHPSRVKAPAAAL